MVLAKGATLQIGSVTPAMITDINGPNVTRDTYESSTHSTSGLYKEFVAGWIDPGEITFTVNFDAANSTHLEASGFLQYLDATSVTTFTLTVVSSAGTDTFTGNCWVTAVSPTWPTEDGSKCDVTLKLTGAITWPT